MIAALLTLTLGMQLPAPAPIPAGLASAEVLAVVQASETHFVASNPSTAPALLVFGNEDGILLGHVTLGPGQRIVFPFTRRGAADVWVEVRQLGAGPHLRSGAFAVEDVVLSEPGAYWFQPLGDELLAWTTEDEELSRVHPAQPFLADVSEALLAHVPGGPVSPPRPDQPPVVPDDVLPPV